MDVSGKMSLKKYFIAIVIAEPFFTEIEALKATLFEQHGLKGALRSPAHITLHRPFEWKEEKEDQLLDTLANFKFQKPFEVALKNFAFFEPRVVYVDVLKNENLISLHDELTRFAKEKLRLFNESEDMRGFHPHVTIAFRDLKKRNFYVLQKEFETKSFEASFSYAGFSLLKLERRWEVLRTFEL